jgi:hypothetical protein
MASVTLHVTVSGGVAPTTINVRFFTPDGHELDFASSRSFEHRFPGLVSGAYDLFIVGMNPAGGNTVCTLTMDAGIILHPPEDSPCTRSTNTYAVEFHFFVP